MSVQLVLKNSSVQDKEATAAQLAVGELALNYHSSGPFLQCEDSAGNIWRLGGVVIASTAPSSPSRGAWWLDSDDNHLYFYDGSSWIEIQTGEIVPGDITEGTARQLLQTNAAGNGTEWTSNVDVPGTLDVTGVATFDNNVVITGNLTVNGTTTTIDTTTLVVEDKNIELGVVGTPTDTTADGGGITVKGATDKTLTWVNSTGMWTSNQPLDVAGEVQCTFLDVNGNSDLSGNLTVGGLTTLHGNLDLQDDDKILLGTGDDLEIFHNGSNSFIQAVGTGDLYIDQLSDDRDIRIRTDNGSGGFTDYVYCDGSTGETKLHHYGNQKFSTVSDGISVEGNVTCDGLIVDGDALVRSSTGTLVLRDSDSSGSPSPQIWVEGQDSTSTVKWRVGQSASTNDNVYLANYVNSNIQFITNGVQRCRIANDGHFVPDTTNAYDLGTSSLQWRNGYFDGTVNCDGLSCNGDATIEATTGLLVLKDTDNGNSTNHQTYISGRDNSNTERWYVGNTSSSSAYLNIYNTGGAGVRFGTSGTARCEIDANGHFIPDADDAYDIGASSKQWRNAYFDGTVNCDGLSCNGAATVESGVGQLIIKDNNNTGTNAASELLFQQSDGVNLGYIGYVSSSDSVYSILNRQNAEIRFGTNNTWRCLITAGGHFKPYTDSVSDFGDTNNRWKTLFVDNVDFSGFVKGVERTATASSFDMSTGNFWTFGAIAVPNPTNQTAGMMGSLRVTAAPTSFAANWKFPGGTYTAPTSFPAVAPFFVQASGTILVGSWTEGIA